MNTLENFLVEIIKIEKCNDEWTQEDWAKDKEYIYVTAKFNCYGFISTKRQVYSKDEWNQIVKKGYYIG